jgi:hypothetical protein
MSGLGGMGSAIGMPQAMTFGGTGLFQQPLDESQNPSAASRRTQPATHSQLSMAIAVYNNCVSDKRIAGVFNSSPVKQGTPSEKKVPGVR